jgi:NAD(P)H-dependent FMN reductase
MFESERLKIELIVGTTRPNRFSEKAARWMFALARQRPELDVEWVDLRDYPLPFYDEPLPPIALAGRYTHPEARVWASKVAEADGYIIVTAEYSHGYPAVLKNALDYVYREWNHKPVGFVGYGNAGGARSIEQLRQVVIELDMMPLRAAVHIPPEVFWAVLNMREGDPDPFQSLNDRAQGFLNELTEWTRVMQGLRQEAAVR